MHEESKVMESSSNIWAAQENLIHFYKLTSVILLGAVLALFATTAGLYFRDPIVVLKSAGQNEFYPSSRAKVNVEKDDVVNFCKVFLTAAYVWSDLDLGRMAQELAPIVEDGLIAKIVDVNQKKYGKEFKGKKLSQAITFVEINVFEDRVVARFQRILKIDGIPLIVPTETTLALTEGKRTRSNPMGIYIAGITEHEGAQ